MKKEIMARARVIAENQYRKDLMMKEFTESDLTHAVLLDLMKAAHLAGRITVEFKGGTKLLIEHDPRAQLDKLDTLF